jgi:hypothetical protein
MQAGELLGAMQAVVSRYVLLDKRSWVEWGAVLGEAQHCLDDEAVAPRESPTAPPPFQAQLRLPHSAAPAAGKVRPPPPSPYRLQLHIADARCLLGVAVLRMCTHHPRCSLRAKSVCIMRRTVLVFSDAQTELC